MSSEKNTNKRVVVLLPEPCRLAEADQMIDSLVSRRMSVTILSTAEGCACFDKVGCLPVFGMGSRRGILHLIRSTIHSLKAFIKYRLMSRFPYPVKRLLKVARSKIVIRLAAAGMPVSLGKTRKENSVLDALIKQMASMGVGDGDVVLIPYADTAMSQLILQVLQRRYPLGEHPTYHLCMSADEVPASAEAEGMSVAQVIRYMSGMNLTGNKVFLYVDKDVETEELVSGWAADVRVADMQAIVDCISAACEEVGEDVTDREVLPKEKGMERGGRYDESKESKYNTLMPDADVASDGQVLFVKQICP